MPNKPGFLLLRPKGKLPASERAFSAAGLNVVGLALLQIEAVAEQQTQLAADLKAAPEGSPVIFVSTEAVRLALEALGNNGLRKDLQYFAVGSSTAQALAKAGIKAQVPERQDSEGLLALDALKRVNSGYVLLIKGEGGRPLIEEKLTKRGCEVVSICLYRRVPVSPPQASRPWQESEIQCIMVTSGELLDAAFSKFDPQWLRQQHWIVVSERLAKLAKDKQIKRISISNGASDDALIEATKQFMEKQAMAETAQQQTPSPSVAKKPDAEVKKTPTPAKGNGLLWFFILVLFVLLGAVAAAGYWGWMTLSSQQNTLQSLPTEVEQKLIASAALQKRNVEQQLADAFSAYEAEQAQKAFPLLSELEQLEVRVADNAQMLDQMSGRRPNDWVLAEADYLVRMAGRKLWLEHDVDTAIRMLKDADVRLQEMRDPSLLPVRQLLAEDIQGLSQIGGAPLTDIALRLGSLAASTDDLPLDIIVLPDVDSARSEAGLSNSVDDWWSNLKQSWHALFDIKVFQTGEIKPLLDNQQQWLIKARLRHQLQMAQQAVLLEQEDLYQQALADAKNLIAQYFDSNQAAIAAVNQSLEELMAMAIARQYPQRLLSAQALQDRLAHRLEGVQL
ncbi:uroporphyrinogen-III C-methyltransferase [Aliiglaciecola sp. CAU 1673]|uniref:uroporphyrinogen-III C-methyltransferase n=1 Tax=Aliiglaciecola sp. CAU 1673 TaxID=3032595 RepID=UPI0023DC3484|nr:uroporphyrinogen-III C-methyltransferase [Aliiglaciecola sp. CAU 1673]MDF2177962.1 uroporphyrinogen-III C-methyltransferase [Aliiglaciecola sp. CAU 1673]